MNRPAGVSVDEIIEQVVTYCDSEDLDFIGEKHFGLFRYAGAIGIAYGMGATDPETDGSFRDRILHHIGVLPKSTAHVHTWKRYEGIMEVYDYCTVCDEKRR